MGKELLAPRLSLDCFLPPSKVMKTDILLRAGLNAQNVLDIYFTKRDVLAARIVDITNVNRRFGE